LRIVAMLAKARHYGQEKQVFWRVCTVSDPRPQFHLKGIAQQLEARTHAVRDDLADIAHADVHFAPHYAAPVLRRCTDPFAPIFKAPDAAAEQISELLCGEDFWLLDISGDWAWGYCAHDHYVGYIAVNALGSADDVPRSVQACTSDPVSVAQGLLGTPYVWGGRGGAGIDCSGLVQTSFATVGIALPRDSDLQLASLANAPDATLPYLRGDIVFFKGHVGMMADATHLLHATKHEMTTKIEPLETVVARYEAEYGVPAILATKRIFTSMI
jgi:cell wall-associated NlpC family hydrolase